MQSLLSSACCLFCLLVFAAAPALPVQAAGTVADKLAATYAAVTNIGAAIAEKGVATNGLALADYADAIRRIGGGGPESVVAEFAAAETPSPGATLQAARGDYNYATELAGGQVSLGCWFKVRFAALGSPAGCDYAGIVSMCGRNTQQGPMALYCNNWTAAGRGVGVYVTGTGGVYAEAISKGDYSDGEWHYAMGTYDAASGDLRLYVDGALAATATAVNAALITTQTINVGRDTAHLARGFHGSVAHVSLWNTVVSEADAKAMYTARTRLTGQEAGLIGYWPCEDVRVRATAATGYLADRTANGHHLHYGDTSATSTLTLDWIADANYPFGGER